MRVHSLPPSPQRSSQEEVGPSPSSTDRWARGSGQLSLGGQPAWPSASEIGSRSYRNWAFLSLSSKEVAFKARQRLPGTSGISLETQNCIPVH